MPQEFLDVPQAFLHIMNLEVGMLHMLKSTWFVSKPFFFYLILPPQVDRTYSAALASGDAIYTSTVSPEEAPVQYLVNGCNSEVFEFDIEEGRWTRLRMLLNAHEFNVIVELVDTDPNSVLSPTLMLLAKDGVYLSDAPRPLGSNRLFFSTSSRVDVLVYAPLGSVGQPI